MQKPDIAAMGNLFLALSDQTRLRLLSLMMNGEVPVGFLTDTLGESQPKVSRHLAYLRSAGLVSTRRDGKWVYYDIASQSDPSVGNVLNAILRSLSGSNVPDVFYQTDHSFADATEDISDDAYMTEWQPAEIDVFLL